MAKSKINKPAPKAKASGNKPTGKSKVKSAPPVDDEEDEDEEEEIQDESDEEEEEEEEEEEDELEDDDEEEEEEEEASDEEEEEEAADDEEEASDDEEEEEEEEEDDGSGGDEADDESDDEGMAMDFDDTTQDDVESGGQCPPGHYHVEVDEAEFKTATTGTKSMKFKFRVLAGAPEHDIPIKKALNKIVFNDVYMTENTKPQVARFATVLGAMKASDLGKKGVKLNLEATIGKQCIIQVVTKKGNDGYADRPVVGYNGIWKIGHEDVADVPLNREALEEAGIKLPSSGSKVAGKKKKKKFADEA